MPTPAFVAEAATAHAFVHFLMGVFAIIIPRHALASRTPTAVVNRELNAFVPVLVTAILLPPAFAIQVLRARVTPVQRARVASVRPVPVQDCALVIRVPIVSAAQAPIATVAKVQPVPVQDCALVVRVPIVCVVLALRVPVQDCVAVSLARSVHAMQARRVAVSLARIVHAIRARRVLVTLARCVHAIQARRVLVTQVRRAPAV
jgi:hypothetical protein